MKSSVHLVENTSTLLELVALKLVLLSHLLSEFISLICLNSRNIHGVVRHGGEGTLVMGVGITCVAHSFQGGASIFLELVIFGLLLLGSGLSLQVSVLADNRRCISFRG